MKKRLKVVAFATLVCFLTTQSVWGAPLAGIEMTGQRELPAYLSIDIPAELGTVDALYEAPAGASPQFILHIQNAHANYQAQMKIKKLLQHMNKKYGFTTIFVEGASEKLDADYLRLFPDQERNMKLCDELAKQGELTGAELFLMEQTAEGGGRRAEGENPGLSPFTIHHPLSNPVEALGIEEASLYRLNYEALKKVFGAEADVTRFFKGFDGKLDKVASSTFTPETRELIADWKRFEQGRRDFMPFVRSLSVKSKKILKVDLESLFAQVGWPQISRLLVIQQMEKEINKAKGVEEQAALIKMLRTKGVSKELLATLENFNEGSIAVGKATTEVSPREVLERLAAEAGPKGFKFSDYPAFSLFAGYVTLRSELDPKVLFEEIEYLFTQMLDTLAKEPQQKALLALYRDGELLRKLLHLELNRTQWREVVNSSSRMTVPSLVARLKEAVEQQDGGGRMAEGVKTGAPSTIHHPTFSAQSAVPQGDVMPPKFAKTMDELFTAGLEFYDYAHKREAVFYKEMQTAMTERKITKAILITGGFHTDGMSDLFRDNAVSYGIVTPRLSEKSDEKLYQRIMLSKCGVTFETSYLDAIANMENVDAAKNQGSNLDVTTVMNAFIKVAGITDFEKAKESLWDTAKKFDRKTFLIGNDGTRYDIEKEGKNYKLVPRAEARGEDQVVKKIKDLIQGSALVPASAKAEGTYLMQMRTVSGILRQLYAMTEGGTAVINQAIGIAAAAGFIQEDRAVEAIKDQIRRSADIPEYEKAQGTYLMQMSTLSGLLRQLEITEGYSKINIQAAVFEAVASNVVPSVRFEATALFTRKAALEKLVLAATDLPTERLMAKTAQEDLERWTATNLDEMVGLLAELGKKGSFPALGLDSLEPGPQPSRERVIAKMKEILVAAKVSLRERKVEISYNERTKDWNLNLVGISFPDVNKENLIKALNQVTGVSGVEISWLDEKSMKIRYTVGEPGHRSIAKIVVDPADAGALELAISDAQNHIARSEAREEEALRGVPKTMVFQGKTPITAEEIGTAIKVKNSAEAPEVEALLKLEKFLPNDDTALFGSKSKFLDRVFPSGVRRFLLMLLSELFSNAAHYNLPGNGTNYVGYKYETFQTLSGDKLLTFEFAQSDPDPIKLDMLWGHDKLSLEKFRQFEFAELNNIARKGGGGAFFHLAWLDRTGMPFQLEYFWRGTKFITKLTVKVVAQQEKPIVSAEARVMGAPELRAEAKRLSGVKALTDNRVSVYVGEVNKVAALVISMPDNLGEFAITDLITPIEIENGHYVIQHLVSGKPETNKDIPLVLPFPINEQMPLNAFTDRLAVSKVFSPDSLNTLKNTTSQMLHDLGLAEEKLMAQPVEVQVAVALTWGIAAAGTLEKVVPLLLAIANLVDAETLTGLRNALQKAVPGIKMPFSGERGNSVRVIRAADLAKDPVASLKLLKFNYTLNPEVTPYIIAMGEATKEHSKVAKWVADQFNQWGSMKKGAQRFEKMKIEVVNPKSAKASDIVNNFLTQVQVNGSYVVSGDARDLQGLPDVILSNLSAKAPVIFETGVNSAVDQPMVMTAVARAAQLIGASKGQSAGDLTNMLIKDQLPDSGYQYTNGRLEINSASIDALRSLQTLFAAFQTIAAAA